MEHNKAPGPNGFLTEFYQIFWEVVKGDLMALFHDFHSRNLALFSLNFGIITLLPKCQAAVKIEQYRPICLLNVSFKIFTTLETNRINKIAQKVIRPSQSAFLTGRYILEGAMVLHETIHEMYKKTEWGFSPLGCQWIQYFVSRGSVAVKVNNEIGRYFQTKKGLKQEERKTSIVWWQISVDKFCFEQFCYKKYRLTKWGVLCLPKNQGGLGILNLEAQNTCLLSKWLYKLINEDGTWQQLLRKKYLKNKTIGKDFWKSGDSHFLSGLMDLSTFQIHNGLQTRFLGGQVEQCPSLFNIAGKKHVSVAHVFSAEPLNISFRRALVGDKLIKWYELVERVAYVQLDGHYDKVIWILTKHG
ncbi:hypothetical protein U9M48_039405 [Paspalum notatum var. saurae]|uniref:Reverse transcriptase domain-containing protein n=1 Tax=Paspalum notatum var. saurae TaxID=547442 RepID=A0AAQ3UNC6_PASNO